MITKKYYYISFIRTFALLSVIFAHFTSNIIFPENLQPISNFVKYFSVFGVFAFFFVSGFLYTRTKGDSKDFWRKKMLSVVIPFLIASTFLFLINMINKHTISIETILGLFGYGNYLWFVPVLLFLFLIFKFSNKPFFDFLMIFISIVTLMILTLNIGNATQILLNSKIIYFVFPQYFGFFALGRITKRLNLYAKLTVHTSYVLIAICLAILGIFCLSDFVDVFYWNFSGQMVAFLFLVLFFAISKLFSGILFDKFCSPFIYTIYLFHMLPFQYVCLRLPYFLSIPWAIVFLLISFAVLYCFSLFFEKHGMLSKIFILIGIRTRTSFDMCMNSRKSENEKKV